jgi:hypothetical protein
MKKAKLRKNTSESTPMAVAVATLFGATALYCAEIIYDNIKDSGAPDMQQLPSWRAHMGSACVGSLAFVISLFLLESLGRGSKRIAMRSVTPWWPIVALTALATAIHVPIYLVIIVAGLYSPWAYFRTRAVR